MKAVIKIDMDNAAFEDSDGYELARILRELADRIEYNDILNESDGKQLHDINGNNVGELKFTR